VKTQGFGAFQVHFMLDLLTQEFDKNFGLLFLYNLKTKRLSTAKHPPQLSNVHSLQINISFLLNLVPALCGFPGVKTHFVDLWLYRIWTPPNL
jgi:hypothetical protein